MMDLNLFIATEFRAAALIMEETLAASGESVAAAGQALADCLSRGNKALLFGNGGSAADAQHFAAELVGRFRTERPSLPALALTTDTSLLTAVGNDYGFEQVYSRQVEALARPGDLAVGLTTGGRSPNVLAALKAARARGAHTLALCGADPSALAPLADIVIGVPSQDTARIQEVHGVIIHILCGLVDLEPDRRESYRENE